MTTFLNMPHKISCSPLKSVNRVKTVALSKLGDQVVGSLDRPGSQLGEEGHEQRKEPQVRLRLNLAARHVDQVADGLKSVERDAHRQQQVGRRRADT